MRDRSFGFDFNDRLPTIKRRRIRIMQPGLTDMYLVHYLRLDPQGIDFFSENNKRINQSSSDSADGAANAESYAGDCCSIGYQPSTAAIIQTFTLSSKATTCDELCCFTSTAATAGKSICSSKFPFVQETSCIPTKELQGQSG